VRVVLACKKTALEFFSERYGATWPAMLERFDLDRIEVREEHEHHHRTLDALSAAFQALGVDLSVHVGRHYTSEDLQGAALVVSVGGDGELLNVARHLRGEHLVLGVRSSQRSAGQLLSPPEMAPEALVRAFAEGAYHVERWTRIEGRVETAQGTVTDLALNEIYVGDRYSVGTARYTLRLDGEEERQRSSGLLVCTGAGSTGWYANVVVPAGSFCLRPEPFARTSRELRFVVRDPIRVPDVPALVYGAVAEGSTFSVKSTMNSDGVVSFDCSKESYDEPRVYEFNRGAELSLRASDQPLRVMCLGT